MADEKLPKYVNEAIEEFDCLSRGDSVIGIQSSASDAADAGKAQSLAIHRYASEREAAALEREDAASRSAMPPEELAEEPASIVALSRLADQAAAHGWDEAAGHLRTAARSLSSAHCNLQTCSEALAECNVRPSNIKWASDAASAIRALIHKEPANG